MNLFNIDDKISALNEGTVLGQEEEKDNAFLGESVLFGSLSHSELQNLMEDSNQIETLRSENLLSEKVQIIKVSKEGQMKRLKAQAAINISREKKDPLFNKLVRAWKVKKLFKDKILKKYDAPADKRAREVYRNMQKSKSPAARKASAQ